MNANEYAVYVDRYLRFRKRAIRRNGILQIAALTEVTKIDVSKLIGNKEDMP